MNVDLYLLDGLLWSVFGFLAGAVTTAGLQWLNLRRDGIEEPRTVFNRTIVIVMVGLALMTVLIAWRGSKADEEQSKQLVQIATQRKADADKALHDAQCQTEFNKEVTEVLAESERIGRGGREQLAQVFEAVIPALAGRTTDVSATIREMREYVASVRERDAAIQNLTVPTLEDFECSLDKDKDQKK